MASVSFDRASKTRTIQFVGADGKRRSLRLGKCSARAAEGVKLHIERLNVASISGQPIEDATAHWLTDIGDALYDRLAGVGLVAARLPVEPVEKPPVPTLGPFLDGYIQKREADTKQATRTVYGRTRRHLVHFFGEDRELTSITAGDATDFRRYLIGAKLADNTVRRTCGFARQFFASAVQHELIARNPFDAAEIKTTVRGNASRFRFVTKAEAETVLEACPDVQSRLLFALARFGGLRTPSETLGLRWSDIDWAKERMIVRSPKTERHEGKESRFVPLYPELRPYLDEAFHQAEENGSEFVLTGGRDAAKNFRTKFTKIIQRAGLKPWPKLFHNLRATRQTELADQFPAHVVCDWMGNSQPVASKHYLHTTEDHFSAAITPEKRGAETARNHSQRLASAAESGALNPEKHWKTRGFLTKTLDDWDFFGSKDNAYCG
jgi:integrase